MSSRRHVPRDLEPLERKVHREQLRELNREKCLRCKRRFDLADGGFTCNTGIDAEREMRLERICPSFKFEPDPDKWRLA